MQRNKIVNKEGLKKLLYSDNAEEKQRNYLNINLLRFLKQYLLESMTQKEKGCVNLYHLENYLIERALDPNTEENYKDGEELIQDTLSYLRSKPFYWIINTEIYLEIISKNENNFYQDDNYINKDLVAVYNYIYDNNFRTESNIESSTDPDYDIPNYINEDDISKLLNDSEYNKYIDLIQNISYTNIDPMNKTVFDITIIPHIFKFIINKIVVEKNLSSSIKIQNFILFFSYVEFSEEIAILWKQKIENNILQTANSKKYNLRISKFNENELDDLYIQKQIKMFEIMEKINDAKNKPYTKHFLNYLKEHNHRDEIVKGENSKETKIEAFLNLISNAYILLNNIFLLLEKYIEWLENEKEINQNDLNKYEFTNFNKLFIIFKKRSQLYKKHLDETEVKEFLEFYIFIVEKKANYEGCIQLIQKYSKFKNESYINHYNEDIIQIPKPKYFEKQFCSNVTEEKLDNIQDEYINHYFLKPENINRRVYKTENGINWNSDDLKKFDDGLRLYGHCQLANNKIAKYMGSHIEVSHVKLLRGKISKERRIKKKKEKEEKINEMKKNRNLNWKVLPHNNDNK